jgi:hypothetical protein
VSVDDRLRALELEWPPEPDVAPRVRARLERPRRRWPRVAIPLAVLVLVAAVPPARSTVLDWLGIGGEKIERVPRRPSPRAGTPLDLGTRVPLPRDALVPAALGRPDAGLRGRRDRHAALPTAIRLPESEHTGAGAWSRSSPAARREEFVRKQVGPDTRIDRVTVRGEPGFWIAGAAHGLLYEDPSGAIFEARGRLAGNALVWRHGDRTLRLEADIPKSRALAIARSIP